MNNIKSEISLKKLALSKANAQIVAVTAIAAFITVFSLVGANYLLGLRSYQSKIIAADHSADNNLKIDIAAKKKLVNAYENFVDQNPNILGSNNQNGNYAYNNATIVLDALPSVYDFPALTSSLQKLQQSISGLSLSSIGGSDESATILSSPSSSPSPIEMPFTFTVNQTNYNTIQSLFVAMLASVRPLQMDSITISGADTSMILTINAHTYFQPSKQFNITSETISR